MDQNISQQNQQSNPMPPEAQPEVQKKSGGKLVIVVAIVILLTVAMGVYIFLSRDSSVVDNSQSSSLAEEPVSFPDQSGNAPEGSADSIYNLDDPQEDFLEIDQDLDLL
jgi:uncharacterized protein HemX